MKAMENMKDMKDMKDTVVLEGSVNGEERLQNSPEPDNGARQQALSVGPVGLSESSEHEVRQDVLSVGPVSPVGPNQSPEHVSKQQVMSVGPMGPSQSSEHGSRKQVLSEGPSQSVGPDRLSQSSVHQRNGLADFLQPKTFQVRITRNHGSSDMKRETMNKQRQTMDKQRQTMDTQRPLIETQRQTVDLQRPKTELQMLVIERPIKAEPQRPSTEIQRATEMPYKSLVPSRQFKRQLHYVQCEFCKQQLLPKNLIMHLRVRRCYEKTLQQQVKQNERRINNEVRNHSKQIQQDEARRNVEDKRRYKGWVHERIGSKPQIPSTNHAQQQSLILQSYLRDRPASATSVLSESLRTARSSTSSIGSLSTEVVSMSTSTGGKSGVSFCRNCEKVFYEKKNHSTACVSHKEIIDMFGGICEQCGRLSHQKGCTIGPHVV